MRIWRRLFALAGTILLFLAAAFLWAPCSKDEPDDLDRDTCSAEVDIKMIDEAPAPSGPYIARRYWVSGGGAAGFLHVNVNVQKDKEPFAWCKGIIANTKRCIEGQLSWTVNKLVVGCGAQGPWETDAYYESSRHRSLAGETFEAEFR